MTVQTQVDIGGAPADVGRRVEAFVSQVAEIRQSLHQVVVGQDRTLDLLLTCALTGSHALLVGVPGLAKTLMVKALASAFHWKFSRVQFTPDLMPSDITGYELLGRDEQSGAPKMSFRPGPVFANLVLADEINRAAPKTQSALLEAMAEQHVTVGGQTYQLEDPFLVVATQNPIEQEGTYPLPEAQLDRFMMEIHIDYPSPQQEEEIVMKTSGATPKLPSATLQREAFLELRNLVWAAPIPQSVAAYAVRLCGSSRPGDSRASQFIKDYVGWGAGPRGSQNLVRAAKAKALLEGRTTPTIEDVTALALPILRHRVLTNHRAVGDAIGSEQIVERLLKDVPR
ncbi:MAG TPA: MoxR family ATPase [Tepidisphaeraceae bacterium]|jgi:MoxR-like ATPase|nr:MoxR family ATPase [Tepidisphaeraceae bacterium]